MKALWCLELGCHRAGDVTSLCCIGRGWNVNSNTKACERIKGTKTHSQKFNVQATNTFLDCNKFRVTPSVVHAKPSSSIPQFLSGCTVTQPVRVALKSGIPLYSHVSVKHITLHIFPLTVSSSILLARDLTFPMRHRLYLLFFPLWHLWVPWLIFQI